VRQADIVAELHQQRAQQTIDVDAGIAGQPRQELDDDGHGQDDRALVLAVAAASTRLQVGNLEVQAQMQLRAHLVVPRGRKAHRW
jgi:hypothetical protein